MSAIGSSSAPAAAGKSTASLSAQLSRCQTQLADWVNCPSGKTPAGKAKIAEINNKISAIEQRLKQPDEAGVPAPATPRSPTTSSGTRINTFA